MNRDDPFAGLNVWLAIRLTPLLRALAIALCRVGFHTRTPWYAEECLDVAMAENFNGDHADRFICPYCGRIASRD